MHWSWRLTLGLAWLIRAMPGDVPIYWRDIPLMIVITAFGIFVIRDGPVTRSEGMILVLFAALVVLLGYRDALKAKHALTPDRPESNQSAATGSIDLVNLFGTNS